MIGLAVKHVNEAKLCCSSWPSGWLASFDLDLDSFLFDICLRCSNDLFFLLVKSDS
jgi:hypothetical protein